MESIILDLQKLVSKDVVVGRTDSHNLSLFRENIKPEMDLFIQAGNHIHT